jgi:hypothetical protein
MQNVYWKIKFLLTENNQIDFFLYVVFLSTLYVKVKLSLQQDMEAHRVVRRRGSHIF